MARILAVEDEKNIRESLEESLSNDYEVSAAASGEEALKLIKEQSFGLMITDIRMPGMSGIDLLKEFRKLQPGTPVIVITAFSSIQNAVEAMKAGASEYVPKPFSLEEIEIKVKNLLEARQDREEREYYREEKDEAFGDFIGGSPAMLRVKKEIKKVAPSGATALVSGETGTGKEMAAYTIHKLSGVTGPFVPVHCAAFSKGVIESELFGHEKGAFTGADRLRKGKIEYAENGTLFLDELGDIPPDIQVKLLRVLESRVFERVGGNRQIKTNARVICATNRDLGAMIQKGEFREDLYYRINVFPVNIPPLRERGSGDVLKLARYFLSKNPGMAINDINEKMLTEYSWPGNVRELQNIVERAAILSDGKNLRVDLALGKKTENDTIGQNIKEGEGLDDIIARIEKDIIISSLKKNNYNQSKTAKALNISRTTLQYKINKYSIKEPGNK